MSEALPYFLISMISLLIMKILSKKSFEEIFIDPYKKMYKFLKKIVLFFINLRIIKQKNLMTFDTTIQNLYPNKMHLANYYNVDKKGRIAEYECLSFSINLYILRGHVNAKHVGAFIKSLVSLDQNLDELKKSLNSVKKFNL